MMRTVTSTTGMSDRRLRAPACVLKRTWLSRLAILAVMTSASIFPDLARAQSPELSMREFASGQIKKGVRSIGFGGDGATWGNYALVWQDKDSAVADYGDTNYTDRNNFQFSAAGLTSPALSHHLAIYAIVMHEVSNQVQFSAKSQGLGPNPVALTGSGSDQAIFSKIAMPLGKAFSVGVLLSHETSRFDANVASNLQQTVHYETRWRPSAGLGATWQPRKSMLFGFRGLLNSDLERRTDTAGTEKGMARTTEFRMGSSIAPWKGALADAGITRLERRNDLAASHSVAYHPNLGFEQVLLDKRLALRGGLDETSPTAGLSLKFSQCKLDTAYVDNMARSRVGNLFGTGSSSFVMTFTFDYGSKHQRDGDAHRE
jgi:hypothetical protein